jgi:predicted nucleic acid-binding protein
VPAAVDTNVLLPVIRGNEGSAVVLVPFLDRFIQSLGLVISAPVYAELLAAPGMDVDTLDRFLSAGAIVVDWDLGREIWLRSATAYRDYARRRQASGGGWPRRILADFVIDAHAELHADFLLTYNNDDFERMFPALQVVVPPAPAPSVRPATEPEDPSAIAEGGSL